MNKNEVNAAFEILLEEIEKVFNILSKEVEEATKNKDFAKVSILSKNGEKLTFFREKIKALQSEWQTIFEGTTRVTELKLRRLFGEWQTIFEGTSKGKSKTRKIKERLKKGLRTPEKEFVQPILEVLVELGGKAKTQEVLNKVYIIMKNKLNKYDMEPLQSTPEKRWKNATRWARRKMVNEGFLKSDSPRGIWEITEKGRKHLEELHLCPK